MSEIVNQDSFQSCWSENRSFRLVYS